MRKRKGSGKWQTPLISGEQQCTTHVVRVNQHGRGAWIHYQRDGKQGIY